MDLLKYEFMDAPETSFNYMIGQLVKKVRYYRSEVPIQDFKAAMPELLALERKIQDIETLVQQPKRNYIQEIMEELDLEDEAEEKLMGEIERASKAITRSLYDSEVKLEDFSYTYRNAEAVCWVEFYGYKSTRQDDGALLVVKEVFRSVCYHQNVIFID